MQSMISIKLQPTGEHEDDRSWNWSGSRRKHFPTLAGDGVVQIRMCIIRGEWDGAAF
jgi:hypothetical protein